jgi:hypothetical protein
VFAGEEPEVPKEIPKPPPKGDKPKPAETKQPGQQTEMESLTAPPTFKRKGGPGGTKPKQKAKE